MRAIQLNDADEPCVTGTDLYRWRNDKRVKKTITGAYTEDREMFRVTLQRMVWRERMVRGHGRHGPPKWERRLEVASEVPCVADCVTGTLYAEKSGECLSSSQLRLA